MSVFLFFISTPIVTFPSFPLFEGFALFLLTSSVIVTTKKFLGYKYDCKVYANSEPQFSRKYLSRTEMLEYGAV